jgi:hypothetical protein
MYKYIHPYCREVNMQSGWRKPWMPTETKCRCFLYLCIRICICIHTCMYAKLKSENNLNVHHVMCVYSSIYVCVCVCVWNIFMCVCVHIYIYMYVCIYIYKQVFCARQNAQLCMCISVCMYDFVHAITTLGWAWYRQNVCVYMHV